MRGDVKKEILYNLQRAIEILEKKELTDGEELKLLSDHAIEDVAVSKDLDLISVTVLIYSIYKIFDDIPKEEYQNLLTELKLAQKHLTTTNFGKYNSSIKTLFNIVHSCNAKVKVHLQDVMHAARIKKGTVLLQKGLSIGQAAGLMGLSNWDLQQYAGGTVTFGQHHELVPAKKRLLIALKIFQVKE